MTFQTDAKAMRSVLVSVAATFAFCVLAAASAAAGF